MISFQILFENEDDVEADKDDYFFVNTQFINLF
jgi:hypothetical protein